jgi:hypothetical protein
MKLKKLLLRYYPPGIILQYERDGEVKQKPLDLLDLTADADIDVGLAGLHVVCPAESCHSVRLAGGGHVLATALNTG